MKPLADKAPMDDTPPALRLSFDYEPVLHTRTKAVLAYEQLARLHETRDASFIVALGAAERAALDRANLEMAQRAPAQLGRAVWFQVFPEEFEATAEALAAMPHAHGQIALEVLEEVPLLTLLAVARHHPDLWLVVDDADRRAGGIGKLLKAARDLPLVVKLSREFALDTHPTLRAFPATWQVVVEEVRPGDLPALARRGFAWVQGRTLSPEVRRLESPSYIHITEISLSGEEDVRDFQEPA